MSATLMFLMFGLLQGLSSHYAVTSLFRFTKELSAFSTAADWLSQAAMARMETGQNIWIVVASRDPGKAASDSTVNDVATAFASIESNLIKYEAELKAYDLPKTQLEVKAKASHAIEDCRLELDSFVTAAKSVNTSDVELRAHANKASDKLLSINDSLSELSAMLREKGQDSFASAEKLDVFNRRLSIGSMLAGALLGLFSTLFIFRASRFLNGILAMLRANSNEVSQASDLLFKRGQTLTAGAVEQTSALQQTAAATEQLSTMVNSNAEQANESTKLTSGSTSKARHGREVVEEMIASIARIESRNAEILNGVDQSNLEIKRITSFIEEIGQKTSVINDIVFQTKLLSFNAAVEAARAGEHGRGFSVVAEEVGNLARMSGAAAQEIRDLLKDGIKRTDTIVDQMKNDLGQIVERATREIADGAKTAERVGQVFDGLVESTKSIGGLTTSIAQGAAEQDRGLREIANAMVRLENLSTENQESASATNGAAENLQAQVALLDSVILKLDLFLQAASQPAVESDLQSDLQPNVA